MDHAVAVVCMNMAEIQKLTLQWGNREQEIQYERLGNITAFFPPIPNALQSPVIRQCLVHTQLARGQLCVKYALPLKHLCSASPKYIKVHCWACTGQPCDMENKHCAGIGGKSWQSAITLQGRNKASFVCAMS